MLCSRNQRQVLWYALEAKLLDREFWGGNVGKAKKLYFGSKNANFFELIYKTDPKFQVDLQTINISFKLK